MSRNDFVQLLAIKVPEKAIEYCTKLFDDQPFRFILSRKRNSKLGDYRFDPKTKSHTVTINEDLNSFQFLITYVHEVAHRRVHEHSRRHKPHGPIWKREFQQLMLPLLRPEIFPEEILRPLARHMKNPKASASADIHLLNALRKYDSESIGEMLKDLTIGTEFTFRNRKFKKLEVKRTRALCLDLDNNKRYLIPFLVEVELD